jgi:hypothetical protein
MFITQVELLALTGRLRSVFRQFKRRSTKTLALLFALSLSLNLILSACTGSNLASYVAIPQFSIGLDKEKVIRIGHQLVQKDSPIRNVAD